MREVETKTLLSIKGLYNKVEGGTVEEKQRKLKHFVPFDIWAGEGGREEVVKVIIRDLLCHW